MQRKLPFLSILVFLTLLLSLTFSASLTTPVMADSAQKKVYDTAGLLTESETAALEKLCNQVGEKRKIDLVVLTLNDPEITDSLAYLNDFYQNNKFGYDKALGNTVLISVDLVNRDIYIRGHGTGETYINNTRADQIAEKTSSYFTDGNYASGFTLFANTVERYMGISPRFNPDSLLLKWYVQLLLAVVVGGISVAVVASNSNPQSTTSSRTYLNATNTNLSVNKDDFIKTTVTRIKKPKPQSNSNSGGGGGGGSTGHSKF